MEGIRDSDERHREDVDNSHDDQDTSGAEKAEAKVSGAESKTVRCIPNNIMLMEANAGEAIFGVAATMDLVREEDEEKILSQLKLKYKEIAKENEAIAERELMLRTEPGQVILQWEWEALKKLDKMPRPPDLRVKSHELELDPVFKLENCNPLTLPNEEYPVGSSHLKLKLVKQFPYPEDDSAPAFELEEKTKDYKQMEKDMDAIYGKFYFKPVVERAHAKEGTFAVLKCEDVKEKVERKVKSFFDEDGVDDGQSTSTVAKSLKPTFKRIKFVVGAHGSSKSNPLYRVEFIDYATQINIHLDENVLLLDKRFAKLPPRVCAVVMDGLSYYKDASGANLGELLAEELENKVVTAEVLENGNVVLFNENDTKSSDVYGINRRIFSKFWTRDGPPSLPPVGHKQNRWYLVHAETSGEVCLQYGKAATNHCLDCVYAIPKPEIEKYLGTVTNPQPGEVYLVLYLDELYFRAVIPNSEKDMCERGLSLEDTVPVRFIDYGNRSDVKVKELVRAKDVHPLVECFPKSYCSAKLFNIEKILSAEDFMAKFYSKGEEFEVHVVKKANDTTRTFTEVILSSVDVCISRGCDGIEYGEKVPELTSSKEEFENVKRGRICLNQRMVEEGYAEEIVSGIDYKKELNKGYIMSKMVEPPDWCVSVEQVRKRYRQMGAQWVPIYMTPAEVQRRKNEILAREQQEAQAEGG